MYSYYHILAPHSDQCSTAYSLIEDTTYTVGGAYVYFMHLHSEILTNTPKVPAVSAVATAVFLSKALLETHAPLALPVRSSATHTTLFVRMAARPVALTRMERVRLPLIMLLDVKEKRQATWNGVWIRRTCPEFQHRWPSNSSSNFRIFFCTLTKIMTFSKQKKILQTILNLFFDLPRNCVALRMREGFGGAYCVQYIANMWHSEAPNSPILHEAP